MQRQYQREPLANEKVNSLINACETLREKQVILTLLDTGLRVSELARLTKMVLLLSLTVSFGVTVILAQPLTGSVIGIVRDEYGQALGSVHVTLLQVSGQPEAATRTDSHGFYHFAFVHPGMYNVQYQQAGYKTIVRRGIRVHVSRTVTIAISMERGRAEEVITLGDKPSLIDSTSTQYETIFDHLNLQELPTARNIWSILESQDPSTATNRIDIGGIKSETIALFGAHGSSWTQNAYRLNGLNVTDPYETGRPLFYPDYDSIAEFQVSSAAHPSEVGIPGVFLNIIPRAGGDTLHGGGQIYYQGGATQNNNIDERLRRLGVTEAERFRNYFSSNAQLSGPILREKVSALGSLSTQEFSKRVPGFPATVKSGLLSGLANLSYQPHRQHKIHFLWTGQKLSDNHAGASFRTPPSATADEKDSFNVTQSHWEESVSPSTRFDLRLGFSHASPRSRIQKGVQEQSAVELFTQARQGAAPLAVSARRSRLAFNATVSHFKSHLWTGWHHITWGTYIEQGRSSQRVTAIDNINLQFFQGDPWAVVKYNTPVYTKEHVTDFSLFFQDNFALKDFLILDLGLRLESSRGSLPGRKVIRWNTLGPRVGLRVPVPKGRGTFVRASYARFYHQLPARYMDFQDPNSLTGEVFRWEDGNGDRRFQPGEEGLLLRRFGGKFSAVDPGLQRPYTDEVTLGAEQDFGGQFRVGVLFYRRDEKRLIATVNLGVPFSAYTPVVILDPGGDAIPGTLDDQIFTVYNQKPETLGQDFYWLTNPLGFRSLAKGLEILLTRNLVRSWYLAVSFAAFKAISLTSPGNSEFENDPGVIGSLFDNPNTLINARGHVFFDRSFIGKISALYRAPFGFHFGGIAKYYDGLPFGRKLIITGLNQGPFFIQATPRGDPIGHRTQFNLTVDLRAEREFTWDRHSLSFIVDVFNLLNLNKNTRENDLTGPRFNLRVPTEIEAPRVFRLGLRWHF